MKRWTVLALGLSACNGGGGDTAEDTSVDGDADTDTDADSDADTDADVYAFDSRFVPGTSSVAYDGQTMRHLLIDDLKTHLGGLTARIDGGFFPVAGQVAAELDFYFSFDSTTSGGVPILKATTPGLLQTVYDEVSSGKDLVGKLAGNDPEGQHKDWTTAFVGWDEQGITTPESLVRRWFEQIDQAAVERSNGTIPVGPDGVPVPQVYLTDDGHDRRELIQKFLLGAIAFSQGADDYLDDDLAGKGLLSSNAAADGENPFSVLEHAWDEGFGYFGAARDYGDMSDELLADVAYSDTFAPDGSIDLLSEVCFGASTNAGKRDLGAIVATDYTAEAWTGFMEGRRLIATTEGELSPAELDTLRGYRDVAIGAWEKAIAASMVHYINEIVRDIDAFETLDYSYPDHAKHWSELKGFALSLQFNPRSPLSDADFASVHEGIGMNPVLPSDPTPRIANQRAGLLTARQLIGTAYGFATENLGDDNGQNGW